MALRSRPLSFNLSKSLTKPQFHSLTLPITKTSFKISCTNNNNKKKNIDMSDAELAAGLAIEMTKINTQVLQKEEAMKKSKELLFKEFCKHLGLNTHEVKQRWSEMDENEKLGLAKGFVIDWGETFHPLSSKSVREMVNEILLVDDKGADNIASVDDKGSGISIDSLKKMIGLS